MLGVLLDSMLRCSSCAIGLLAPLALLGAARAPEARLVERSPHYSEGVVFDAKGALFYSQTELGSIRRITRSGGLSREWAIVPGANGHKVLPNGMHVVAGAHGIFSIDASGRARILFREVAGQELIAPNDIAVDPRGGFYFTDAGSTSGLEQQTRGAVYHVDQALRPKRIASGFAFANGLAVSHDGTRLFVGESVHNRIWAIPLARSGEAGARALFADLPGKKSGQAFVGPDGMLIDPATSDLLVAHYGAGAVLVLGMDGRVKARLAVGNEAASNLALRPGTRDLYVSGSPRAGAEPGAIFRLEIADAPGSDVRDGIARASLRQSPRSSR